MLPAIHAHDLAGDRRRGEEPAQCAYQILRRRPAGQRVVVMQRPERVLGVIGARQGEARRNRIDPHARGPARAPAFA